MKNNDMAGKINLLRKSKGLTLEQVGDAVGVGKSTVRKWETGIIANMRRDKIAKLAEILGTTPAYLMGWEDEEQNVPSNAIPVPPQCMLPVLGRVAAGCGCLAESDILFYEPADARYCSGDHFYLVVSGDSMQPMINDGDVALVRKQSSIDNGSVGVFLINGDDGVIKKAEYDHDHISLISFNPYYPPRIFQGSELDSVRVVGKVIETKHKW